MCFHKTFMRNYGKIFFMKIFFILTISLILISCSSEQNQEQSKNNNNSDEIFFECDLDEKLRGTFANITYNKTTDTASFVSDWMSLRKPDGSRGEAINYKVVDTRMSSDELVIGIADGYFDDVYNFKINRQTLKFSGLRTGNCKIVDKKVLF